MFHVCDAEMIQIVGAFYARAYVSSDIITPSGLDWGSVCG